MRRHSSSVRSIKARRPPPPMPALAKQPSTLPNVSRVAFIAAFTEAGSETSQTRLCTLPGPADMVAAAFVFFSALRPQIETLQPCAFSACAMPRPIPPLPPVMTAVRPVRSKMLIGCSHLLWRTLSRAPSGGQMFWCNHGQARPENQIWVEIPSSSAQRNSA
jgi:hypothetical protein